MLRFNWQGQVIEVRSLDELHRLGEGLGLSWTETLMRTSG